MEAVVMEVVMAEVVVMKGSMLQMESRIPL